MGTEALRAVLLLAHLAAAATWLGGMVYSLAIVQPRVVRKFAGARKFQRCARFQKTVLRGTKRLI